MIATLIVTVCLCLCLLGTDSAGSNPLRTDNWLVGNGDSDRTFSGNGWNSGGIGSRTNNRREVSRERFLDSVFSLFYGETYVHEAVSSERNGDSDCRSFSYSCSADSPDSNGRLVASEEKFGDGTTEIEEDSEIESEQDIANPSAHSEKLRMGGSGGDDGDGEGNADNSDSQRPLKVLKGSSQELYSNVDVNDLSPRDRSIHELKLLWRGFVQPSPSEESVQQLMAVGVDGARKDIFLPAMGNTNRTALYQQLLHQFLQPVSMTGRKTQWLDQEFSLMIKGIAAIAQYPELTEKIAGVPKVTRGIHVGGPAKSTGLQAFMHTMITALAHSLQTNIVYLNARTMESVRQQAQDLGISAKLLTKHGLLSALFEFIQDDGKPYMVILNDNLSWLLNNHAVSKLFLDELNSAVSRAFFVLTDPDDGLRIGQTLPSLAIKESGSTSEADSSQGQSPNPTFFGGYPPFNPFNGNSASGSNPQSSNSNNLPKSQGVPQEFPFPPPPNGMHRPMVTGRSFQVVIQNGTATMTPLPPGTVPPGFPGSNPEAFMKRIMEHQKMMQQRQKDGQMAPGQFGFSFPNSGFPADMTEEDFHEFMQDPENQAKLKGMIDSMMQAITQQLSQMPGNNPFGINPNEMTNVDVQMHMMPFPTPPADTASATSREKESVSTGANSSVDDFENDDSEESDDDSSLSVSSNKLEEDKKIEKTSKGFQGLFKQFRSSRGDSKISKSKSKDDPAKTEKNLSSEENPGDLDVDEKSVCASGKAFLNLVEHLHIDPPREHGLRSVWDQMIDDEIGGKILKANKRSINIEMKKCNIKRVSGALKALEDVLKRQVLSREDVKKALLNAIKLQAGSIAHVECDTPSTTPATQKVASVDANTGEIILSQWALDTAFSTLVNLPTPRLGKLTVRTKEEMNNLAVDKHERALVANVISPQDIGVTYDMIGGLDEVKEMLRQCITYPLKYPRLYQEGVASEAVKGVLLFGPPGTGKTMLAKAVATEGGATFLTVDTSTIENKWLGESEKNARAVFTLARRLAPCVIYLDEVDSILSSREHGDESSHGTLTSVKTTLMQEWDGLRTTKDRVVVIASTNRPFDLDEAVLRRLPRRIMVDLPDLATRMEILKVTLSRNRVSPDIDFKELAESLDGFTGSDIREVCREAVVRVAHERAKFLETGIAPSAPTDDSATSLDMTSPLRPVSFADFKEAMKKMKASVDDNGRELQKVVEWNEKFGEIKKSSRRQNKASSSLSMYM